MANTSYDTDFALWAIEQAGHIRAGRLDQLDLENVAEEVASIRTKECGELRNRLTVLLEHLLKLQYQSMRRGQYWTTTVIEQRLYIHGILEDSPSLCGVLQEKFDKAYESAVHLVAMETGIPYNVFPKSCPYTLADVLENGWLPVDLDKVDLKALIEDGRA